MKSYETLQQIAQDNYSNLMRADYVIDSKIAGEVLNALTPGQSSNDKTTMLVNLIAESDIEEREKLAVIYPDHVLSVMLHMLKPAGRNRLEFISKAQGTKRNYDPQMIKIQREKLGATLEDFAEHMNVTKEKALAWEDGEQIPDALELGGVADYFNISTQSFYALKKSNKNISNIDEAYDDTEELVLTYKQKQVFFALESAINNSDEDISKSIFIQRVREKSIPGFEDYSESSFLRYINIFRKMGLMSYDFGSDSPILLTHRGRMVNAN